MNASATLISLGLDETQATGPRGGHLDNGSVDRRTASFNPVSGAEGSIGLHKFVDRAVVGLKEEQPWHRMAAHMLLAGRSNDQVAQSAGVTAQMVSTLKAQRWFQEMLATVAAEIGADIMAVVKGEALASVAEIVALRDSSESDRIRLSASTTLLEFGVGKPTQRIITENKPFTGKTPAQEYDEIQKELADLRLAAQRN